MEAEEHIKKRIRDSKINALLSKKNGLSEKTAHFFLWSSLGIFLSIKLLKMIFTFILIIMEGLFC